jgi:hypothetical protein
MISERTSQERRRPSDGPALAAISQANRRRILRPFRPALAYCHFGLGFADRFSTSDDSVANLLLPAIHELPHARPGLPNLLIRCVDLVQALVGQPISSFFAGLGSQEHAQRSADPHSRYPVPKRRVSTTTVSRGALTFSMVVHKSPFHMDLSRFLDSSFSRFYAVTADFHQRGGYHPGRKARSVACANGKVYSRDTQSRVAGSAIRGATSGRGKCNLGSPAGSWV